MNIGFSNIRRSSNGTKIGTGLAAVLGLAYCVVLLYTSGYKEVAVNYTGFMVNCAPSGVLLACLILLYAGSVRYSSFELVRCDPRMQLRANLVWVFIVGCVGAICTLALFAVMEFVVFGEKPVPASLSPCLLLLVQTFMMVVSVGLICMLLVNLGIPWGRFLPILIGFMVVANWLLAPFAGNAVRYAYYFWYPISPLWSQVVPMQIIPFILYTILMVMANIAAFGKTDRLDI